MNTIETGLNNARDSEVWSRSWTHFKGGSAQPQMLPL
jgi:hypothetical protein